MARKITSKINIGFGTISTNKIIKLFLLNKFGFWDHLWL